jgi:hypothetical protein
VRTYGRTPPDEFGKRTWKVVTTDANGFNDEVYFTTLVQVLQLNLGESPFFGNYGIPARPTVMQQVFPDYYVTVTQQQFAKYFASLIIAKIDATDSRGFPYPAYKVSAVAHYGAKFSAQTSAQVAQ